MKGGFLRANSNILLTFDIIQLNYLVNVHKNVRLFYSSTPWSPDA